MKKAMLFCLAAVMVTSAQAAVSIDKSFGVCGGHLGDVLTVTLVVTTDAGATVEDPLPGALKYIPGTFQVDGTPVTPTVVGNTISTTVGAGAHTITFDVQIVEAPAVAECVTNTATVSDGVDSASASWDLTIYPYTCFSKGACVSYEAVEDGVITVGELVQWNMIITLGNSFGWDITNAALSDNLGGELGLAGDGVDNDQDGDVDDGAIGDLTAASNTIPTGTLAIETKGKTDKVQLDITGISVPAGGSVEFVLAIFTDKNPGKKNADPSGTQEYTSPGCYELNSGAVVKFTDPGTGFQLSAHTVPLTVEVTGEDPD